MAATEALRDRRSQIPIFSTLHLRLGDVAEGSATLTAPYDKVYENSVKSFHGGLLMTLADSAAYVAVLTLAGAHAAVTTTDMNIRFLAPCRSDATAYARIIKFGKTLCPVSVEVRDTNDVQVPWRRSLTCAWESREVRTRGIPPSGDFSGRREASQG